MILESGKIYQRKYFTDSLMCPTLEIKGSAKIYVSNSATEPESTTDMALESDFEDGKVNTIIGMTRWICAVYEEGSEVREMGLISSPYKGE